MHEHILSGGNAFSGYAGVTLSCEERPDHALWALKAGVGCDNADPFDADAAPAPAGFCSKGAGAPIAKFGVGEEAQRVNTYHLVRYAFRRTCTLSTMKVTRLEPLTGKQTGLQTKTGWECREVNLVDGATQDKDPAKWTYVTMTTTGPLASLDNDYSDMPILGLSPDDGYFSHRWHAGKACDTQLGC